MPNKDIAGMDIEDIYNLLLNRLGFPKETYDSYGVLEGDDVVTYTDTSYHGSPDYRENCRIKLPPNMAMALRYLTSFDVKSAILKASAEDNVIKAERRAMDIKKELGELSYTIENLKQKINLPIV